MITPAVEFADVQSGLFAMSSLESQLHYRRSMVTQIVMLLTDSGSVSRTLVSAFAETISWADEFCREPPTRYPATMHMEA